MEDISARTRFAARRTSARNAPLEVDCVMDYYSIMENVNKQDTQYKADFIAFMVGCGVLKFGSFTLKSGRLSPFFMNAGSYVTGGQMQRLGEFYARAIHDNFGSAFDVLFGPAYKGIPLSVATAMAWSTLYGEEKRWASARKEAKDHGEKGIILGSPISDGDRILIVEDVATSGKSIEETLPVIMAQGKVQVVGEIVSLDRMELAGGEANGKSMSALEAITSRHGFPAKSIVSMADVIDVLYTHGDKSIITPAIKAALDAYYAEWGAKK